MSNLSQLQEESGRNSIFSLYQPWLQTVLSVQWHCGCWPTLDILKCVLEHPLTVSSIVHVQMPQNFPLDLQRGSRGHSEKEKTRVARPPCSSVHSWEERASCGDLRGRQEAHHSESSKLEGGSVFVKCCRHEILTPSTHPSDLHISMCVIMNKYIPYVRHAVSIGVMMSNV